jgi:hypothetical protein
VKHTFSIVSLTTVALIAIVLIAVAGSLTFWTPGAAAQPFMSGNQQHSAPQAAPAQPDGGGNMGMGRGMMNGTPTWRGRSGPNMMYGPGMMDGQNMMDPEMHAMPIMPSCGDGMMGPGPMGKMMMRGMMGSAKDLKVAAKMMEMRADMMKASAQVMEKYANEMDGGK